jgi:ribosomal protein S18 acetylase RimI-like enzyme
MNDELARAFAFMARADIGGSRVERFDFGTAVFTDELPLRHDSNYLLVEQVPPETTAEKLAAEADRLQGEAGLEHRALIVPDEETGRRLVPGFARLGWLVDRHLVMVERDGPRRTTDVGLVREVDEATLRPGRERYILSEPWGTPEVARQLLEAKLHIARRVHTRFLAVLVDDRAVSWTDVYWDGDSAQIEDVGTLPEYRGRGYASAVVLRGVEEARREGNDFVFLVADDEDWPKELYARLGFVPVGRYYKFTRVTSGRPDETRREGRAP